MVVLIRHYLISGRVQGVGFRAFTQRVAKGLQLKGWVRNLSDGRVEAIAVGTEQLLTEFETQLRQGPKLSQVESVVVVDGSHLVENLVDFEFRKDSRDPCSRG